MENKKHVYFSSCVMYILVGFAGYISQIGSYWIVFLLCCLAAASTLTSAFLNEISIVKETLLDWVSVCVFLLLESILTICIEIVGVSYTGFFKYFNYLVQCLGIGFITYSIIRFVLMNTHFIKKEVIYEQEEIPAIETINTQKEEISTMVEEAIEQETILETVSEDEKIEGEVEIVGQTQKEPEIIGLEYKNPEIETPYMEEEL